MHVIESFTLVFSQSEGSQRHPVKTHSMRLPDTVESLVPSRFYGIGMTPRNPKKPIIHLKSL